MEEKSGILRVDSIYKNGYGSISKFVMHDFELSLESKAIYAYFCALAGSGNKTFPYRETILKNLKISKNTYYVHYKALVDQGYIEVKRPFDMTKANIYTIVANPKKLMEFSSVNKNNTSYLKYNGLKSQGYGFIPKYVMLDEKLSIKAKGLYAYFCSYCGSGDCSFPLKSNILFHLNISEPTYYKCLSLLKELGYLNCVQRKCNGKFSVNNYFLIGDIGKAKPRTPSKRNWDNKKWDNSNWDTNNCDTILRTVFSKNKYSKNNQSIEKPFEIKLKDGWIEKIQNINFNNKDKWMQIVVDEIKTLKSHSAPLANKGYDRLCACLEQEDGEDYVFKEIHKFISVFKESSANKQIRKPIAYFKASLWNYFAEERFKNEVFNVNTSNSSYDLKEIENYINTASIFN